MKKLWTVEISTEVVVLAETRAEAERIASRLNNCELPEMGHEAHEMSSFPYGWAGDEIPYGAENDETIGELIEQGAAPRYTELRKRLNDTKPL